MLRTMFAHFFFVSAAIAIKFSPPVNPIPAGPPQACSPKSLLIHTTELTQKQPIAPYMVDNRNNYFGVAPDKGILNSPIASYQNQTQYREQNATLHTSHGKRQSSGTYWMESITHGQMPLAPPGYTFFRNVMDFGAKGDGVTDDTVAINMAASSGNRCGEACGATTTLGAIVYFPPGKYVISTPIIQYYYTQFIGDANNVPIISGSPNFTGIALIDTDVYIPGADGLEWYINQNQFYRSIRNFQIDLTMMPNNNTDGFQTYMPTGIHWQVSQSTSLQNIFFNMPQGGTTTAVGIFMENGSGGFVEDLSFFGGNIGFMAGSQQFTARNLQFTSCAIAIKHIWNWSFTWKNIFVFSCFTAIDCTKVGGANPDGGPPQGTGSITVLDSHFNSVPFPITLNSSASPLPNIVIDNLHIEGNTPAVVLFSGGATVLEGTGTGDSLFINQWAMGRRYTNTNGAGASATGYVTPIPTKPTGLLDSTGNIFEQSKPLYETLSATDFVIATAHNIANDGTGDQHDAINALLASNVGTPIYFPAGIYLVEGTVEVPVNSIIVGEAWSQIMGSGAFFSDQSNPQPIVQVGKPGDTGVIQMTDLLFTVQGGTAGAILLEWNVHESTQGSAAMWDCHFRVGGAAGSKLQLADCPAGSTNMQCQAASMLMHVTSEASGYFSNVWAWVADHDNDVGGCDGVSTTCSQLSVFGGRGILIESNGPTWLYGTASEHSVLYQYQLSNATNIYMGLIQTETPYFQPDPTALTPFKIGQFPSDPTFDDCGEDFCSEAWALRVLDSSNILIYGAGLYSFFSDFSLDCNTLESCQERVLQTSFTQGLWIYNLATKGVVQMVSPAGGIPPTLQSDDNQSGYTTEVSVWIELGLTGATLGIEGDSNSTGSGIVYIDPSIWSDPDPEPFCFPPCTLIMPPQPLPPGSTTTITFPEWSTQVFYSTLISTVTILNNGDTTTLSALDIITVPTIVSIPAVTTTAIPVWAVTITSGQSPGPIFMTSSIEPSPFAITITPTVGGSTTIRGGTTTTIAGTTEFFSWLTFIQPPLTETVGGSTSVSSGTTLAPIITTVTPHPYPTTTNTPDPALNTHSTSWGVGPAKPSCVAFCGTPCFFFCISSCPFCPPGIGPPGSSSFNTPGEGGNPDDGGDDNDDECETTTTQDCTSFCTADATPPCSSTCSNVVGCEVTPTSTGSTETLPIGITLTACPWSLATIDSPATLSNIASAQKSMLSSIYASDPAQTSPANPPGFSPTSGPLAGSQPVTSPPITSPPVTTQPPTSTVPPAPSTGIAIGNFFACPFVGDPCAEQWQVFPASPPDFDYDGCSTKSALYTTVVDNVPTPSNVPKGLGPFDVDGFTNCEYNGNLGLTCNPNAICSECTEGTDCASNTGFCDVPGITADGAGFETDMVCMW